MIAMMSRKDFIKIAYVLHNWKDKLPNGFINDLCIELMSINPRFDTDKFKDAINKEEVIV